MPIETSSLNSINTSQTDVNVIPNFNPYSLEQSPKAVVSSEKRGGKPFVSDASLNRQRNVQSPSQTLSGSTPIVLLTERPLSGGFQPFNGGIKLPAHSLFRQAEERPIRSTNTHIDAAVLFGIATLDWKYQLLHTKVSTKTLVL